MYCLQCFSSEEILDKHKNNCIIIYGKQSIKIPNKGETLEFTNFQKQALIPFIIYADFEAIVEKIQGAEQSEEKSYTDAYQKHKDCSMYIKLYVVMMITLVNHCKCTEEKMLFINSMKRC